MNRVSLPIFRCLAIASCGLLFPLQLRAQDASPQTAAVVETADPTAEPQSGDSAQAAADAAPVTKEAEASRAAVKRFDILEYVIDGNSVLDELAIDQAVEPYLGPERTTDDVDKARASLEQAYRDRGFKTVTVSIPRQNVREGVVQLQVVEGIVGHLNVVGSRFHSIERIKNAAPSIAEGEVPDFRKVQQDLANLNGEPGRRVTPSMRAGRTPGTVDIDLVVKDESPLHGSLEVNNRHSQDTTNLRSSATLSYDNLWQRSHSLTLSYQTAPRRLDDAKVLFGSYLARFDDSPFSLLFNALRSDSNVATVGGINVVGKGKSFGVRGVVDLEGAANFYPTLSFGVDYKRFNTQVNLDKGGSFETPLTYYPFSIAYAVLYRGDTSITQADVSAAIVPAQLGTTRLEADASTFDASRRTFYVRENVSHTHDLPLGAKLFVRLSSQLTDRSLISNEQFSAGGMDSVRGYQESTVLGDYGFGGTFELRSPSLADHLAFGESTQFFQDLTCLAFLDGAKLWLRDPAPEVAPHASLLSTGGGINLKLTSYLNGTVLWAAPILSKDSDKAWSSRILFRIWSSF